MPTLTPIQKRELLIQHGYNPDQVELDDDGGVYQRSVMNTETQPAVNSSQETLPQSSATGAFGRAAKRSLLPTLGGLGSAAAASAAVGGSVLSGGTLAPILIPLAAGIAGGAVTGLAQDKLAPLNEAEKAQQAADIAEHPVAQFAGEAAPSLLGFRPSLNALRGAKSLVNSQLASRALTPLEKANLLNVGIGATLPLATEGVVPLLQGQEVDKKRLAASMALGAVNSEPWLLGRVLGFHPTAQAEAAPRKTDVENARVASTLPDVPVSGAQAQQPPWTGMTPEQANMLFTEMRSRNQPRVPSYSFADYAGAPLEQMANERAGMPLPKRERVSVESTEQQQAQPQQQQLTGDVPNELIDIAAKEKQRQVELQQKEVALLKQQNDAKEQEINNRIAQQAEREATLHDELNAPLSEGEQIQQQYDRADYGAKHYSTEEATGAGKQAEHPDVIAARKRLVETYNKAQAPTTYAENPADRAFAQRLGAYRGAERVQETPVIPENPRAQGAQQGRDITLATTKAQADAPLHEQYHMMHEDILKAGAAKEKAFLQQAEAIMPDSPRGKHEELTRRVGYEAARRAQAGESAAEDIGDIKAWGRVKLGRGSIEDYTRLAARKLLLDPAYSEGLGLKTVGNVASPVQRVVSNNSEEKELKQSKKFLPEIGDMLKFGNDRFEIVGFGAKPDYAIADKLLEQGFTPEQIANNWVAKVSDPTGKIIPKGKIANIGYREGVSILKKETTPSYIGTMGEDIGMPTRLYNLKEDIKDPVSGVVKHAKDSTVSEATLKKYGVKYSEEDALKFSKELEDEIKFKIDSAKESDETITRENALRQLIEDSDFEESSASSFKKELQDYQIKTGIVKPYTKEELSKIYQTGRGKKYDFKRGDKYYRFEDWGPLKDVDIKHSVEEPLTQQEVANFIERSKQELETVTIPKLRSALDEARATQGREGRYFADVADKAAEARRRYIGKFFNPAVDVLKGVTSKEAQAELSQALYRTRHDKAYQTLSTPELQRVYDYVVKDLMPNIGAEHIKNNMPIWTYNKETGRVDEPRLMKQNEFYTPDMISVDVLQELQNHPDSARATQLRKDYIDFMEQHGVEDKVAKEDLGKIISSSNKSPDGEFNAFRIEQGVGLPYSWVEKNPVRLVTRYVNRAARDMALHNSIQVDPIARQILGIKEDPWGRKNANTVEWSDTKEPILNKAETPAIKAIWKQIRGDVSNDEALFNSATSFAKSLFIGPLSKIKDITSNFPLLTQYANASQIPGMAKAMLGNWREGSRIALEQGVTQRGISAAEMISETGGTASEHLNRLRDIINRVQGSEQLEEFSRGVATAGADFLIRDNIQLAQNATGLRRENAMKFIKEFSKGEVKSLENVTPEQINEMTARLVNKIQSTYDYRDLPTWMLSSGYMPALFTLQKWGIAQTNNFVKNVQRDPLKVLTTGLLGAAIGGELNKELSELVNNKKMNIPSFAEANSEGAQDKASNNIYALTAALQYAGYAGVISDYMKMAQDVMHKNKANPIAAPAQEVITDVIGNVSDALVAIKDGENVPLVLSELAANLARNNIQSARILMNQLGDKKDIARKNRQRDLRVFEQTHGYEYQDYGDAGAANTYKGIEQRKFKREDNAEEAMKEGAELVQKALAESKTPEELKKKLQGLKTQQISWMPSIESSPLKFVEYLQFVRETSGEKAADKLIEDYFRQRSVNSIKSAIVPSLGR